MALWACLAAERDGARWALLPLEETRSFYLRRFAAMLGESWAPLDDPEEDPSVAARAREIVDLHREDLDLLAGGLFENPALPQADIGGHPRAGEIGWRSVLDWIASQVESARLVVVDPFSQIAFDARDPYRSQADFIREAVGLAQGAGATVLLVTHTIKAPDRDRPLILSDVQGAAELTRLPGCVLLLDAHEEKDSPVYRAGGAVADESHDRTITIAKARHGRGTGERLALLFGAKGPVFWERGVIAPRKVADKLRRSQAAAENERVPYGD
jgi:hypothetical protein